VAGPVFERATWNLYDRKGEVLVAVCVAVASSLGR
jgi:hypothetical protein